METQFVCLANSKKYGERCVAGIEVSILPEGNKLEFTRNEDGSPKWIRPVTHNEHGEVPIEFAGSINLLDVVHIGEVVAEPDGYQCENVFFELSTLKRLGKVKLTKERLDSLCSKSLLIFGNRGKALHIDVISQQNCSLVLIKPRNIDFHFEKREYSARTVTQLRVSFTYHSNNYDLPVTDVSFISQFGENQNILESTEDVYFTISLGVEYEEWHHKLVAGVIWV